MLLFTKITDFFKALFKADSFGFNFQGRRPSKNRKKEKVFACGVTARIIHYNSCLRVKFNFLFI